MVTYTFKICLVGETDFSWPLPDIVELIKDINLIPSTDDALPDNLQAHSEVMTKEIPQVKSHDKPTYFVDLLMHT